MVPKQVNLLILDVDGVLTDGGLSTTPGDGWGKRFYVQDGCAIKLWQRFGGTVAILSGRSEACVAKRAEELGITHVRTGVGDKLPAYESILAAAKCDDGVTGYVGDDLPDLGPMGRAGFPIAVANAHPAVKRSSMYVTRRRGGDGAVAEVVELLLRRKRRWCEAMVTSH